MTRERSSGPRRPPPPLGTASLEALALRYVERYATTRGKLVHYLRRKIMERGWGEDHAADPVALADRMAGLGYVDDRGFAEARGAALVRRGFGVRRVTATLQAAGIAAEDRADAEEAAAGVAFVAALAFARRRRIGPYAMAEPDQAARDKAIAALLRAGHDFALARRIVAARPGEMLAEDHG